MPPLTCLAALIALVPQDRAVDEDVRHYLPGADRISFQSELDWSLTRFGFQIDGEDLDLGDVTEDLGGVVTWTRRTRDLWYLDGGALEAIDRDYEDVALVAWLTGKTNPFEDRTARMEVYGGMERERVRFRTAAQPGTWNLEVPESSPLKARGLGGLGQRIDLFGFGPPPELIADGELVDGTKWQVPLSELEPLLFPLGHPATLLAPLGWAKISDVDVPTEGPVANPEGELEATWRAPGDESPGKIELRLGVTFELDPLAALAAAGQAWLDGRELETGLPELRASGALGGFEVELAGKGELVWDLERGGFVRLDLPCEFETRFEGSLDLSFGSIHHEWGVYGEARGEVRLEYDYQLGSAALARRRGL